MTLLALFEGSLFAGRYQIVRCIAQGGMGSVYEVIHIETDRRRALKVMLPSLLQSDEMRSRFRLEARVTARIASEYIVDVIDAGIDDATKMPFLVMDLLEGEELNDRVQRLGRLDPSEVVTYLHQASLALDKTHRASIVHRDLKPDNLFLTEREDGSPRIKVLDFGIAKLIAEGASNPTTQPIGAPLYMAPEQFHVGVRIGPAVDIFALGMIAFTLLTGKPYWYEEGLNAPSPHAVYVAIMQGPGGSACARAMRLGVNLPPAFDAWFARVTARAPHERFPTASSAIVALAEVFGVPVSRQTRTFTRAEIKPAPAPPSPSPPPPLAPTNLAPTIQQRLPEKASDAPLVASPSLSSLPTVPLSPSHGKQAAHASPHSPGLAVLSSSTTAVGSHAIAAKLQARGPGAVVTAALATALVVALIAGSAFLMRERSAGNAGRSDRPTSEENPAPSVSGIATSSLEEPHLPGTAQADPASSQTAQAIPRSDSSGTQPTPKAKAVATGATGANNARPAVPASGASSPKPAGQPGFTIKRKPPKKKLIPYYD